MCLQPASHGLAKDCSSHKGSSPGRAFSEEITPPCSVICQDLFQLVLWLRDREKHGPNKPWWSSSKDSFDPQAVEEKERVFKGKGKRKAFKMVGPERGESTSKRH